MEAFEESWISLDTSEKNGWWMYQDYFKTTRHRYVDGLFETPAEKPLGAAYERGIAKLRIQMVAGPFEASTPIELCSLLRAVLGAGETISFELDLSHSLAKTHP